MSQPQTNIFQVTNFKHLSEILDENSQKLVVIMYSSTTCPPCKIIKPKFIQLSKQNLDCFFVYLNVDLFKDAPDFKFTRDVEYTPSFKFIFNNQVFTTITGVHEQALVETIVNLKSKIEERRQAFVKKEQEFAKEKLAELNNQNPQSVPNPTPSNTEILMKKYDMINQIYVMAQQLGTNPSKVFDPSCGFDELALELQRLNMIFQQKQQSQQQSQQLQSQQSQQQPQPQVQQNPGLQNQFQQLVDQQNQNKSPEESKQDQLKQVFDLHRFKRMMDAQHLYKIQQLRAFQKMKEQQERDEEENKKH